MMKLMPALPESIFDVCYQILRQKRNTLLRLDDPAAWLRRRYSSCAASAELLDKLIILCYDYSRLIGIGDFI